MRHPQPQWLVRITAESGSLTLALVWRPRHQPPVVIQLYSVYGLISNTMFAQSKEMNQAVDIYTALSTHRKVQISIRTNTHSIYTALGVDIYTHGIYTALGVDISSDPHPGPAPPCSCSRECVAAAGCLILVPTLATRSQAPGVSTSHTHTRR